MENKKGKTLKLISYISLCAFSLVSLFSGVLAWFTARRVQDPDSDSMRVVNPNGLISQVTIYKQTITTGDNPKTQPFIYDSTPIVTYDLVNNTTTKNSNPTLGTYDQLEPRESLLYLFKVNPAYATNDSMDLSIKAKTETEEKDCFLKTVDENGNVTRHVLHPESSGDETTENDGETSLIKFYLFTLNGEPATWDYTKKTEGSANIDYDYTKFNHGSFVTLDNEGLYSSFHKEVSIYHRGKNEQDQYNALPKYIGMICGYYEEAVQTLYGIYLNHYALERVGQDGKTTPVIFNCDWTLEIA